MKTLELSAEEKRKSLLLTVVIYALFLLILFFIRFWPPANAKDLAMLAGGGGGGGVTINFGNSDFGSGKDFQNEELNVKSVAKPAPTQSEPEEDIISSESSIDENTAVIPKKVNSVKAEKPKVKIDPKPVVETKPKVSKNTNDALSSILSGSKKGGDGDDSRSGNKGKANGSLGSNDYYGSGGSGGGTGGGNGTGNGTGTGSGSGSGSGGGSGSGNGGGTGYYLGNRKALEKPRPNSRCSDEEGNVVVEITVDKNGNVIKAVPGVKGTTVTASCLKEQARLAAMNTKWQASADAPDRQVGKIIYNFSLN